MYPHSVESPSVVRTENNASSQTYPGSITRVCGWPLLYSRKLIVSPLGRSLNWRGVDSIRATALSKVAKFGFGLLLVAMLLPCFRQNS